MMKGGIAMGIQIRLLRKSKRGICRNRLSAQERDALDYLTGQGLIRSRCDIAPDCYFISEAGRAKLAANFKDNVRYNITTGISVAALILSVIALALSGR